MWPLKMTDICVKIYIGVICFTWETIDFVAVVVVVVAVVVVAYLHKWCQVIIALGNGLAPNGLPGPIPQFRDNLFKTHGYFAIKQNETNISSSTIYLKTNEITNTTRTQILHRVYANHIYITKPQQQTRPNWRHKPPCEILLSHLVVTGPCTDETKHGIWKTVFCVVWSTSARSHLGGPEK